MRINGGRLRGKLGDRRRNTDVTWSQVENEFQGLVNIGAKLQTYFWCQVEYIMSSSKVLSMAITFFIGFGARAGLVPAPDEEGRLGAAVLKSEFIFERAPFAECHASTIVETEKGGLVSAWFGGDREGAKNVGIWLSRLESTGWMEPVEVADGIQADKTRWPCWNPVLFQPNNGPLLLFYKVGPSPRAWWGMMKTSADGGRTWSAGRRLPEGILGPIKNKPVQLAGGEILCPSSTEDHGWRVHFEWTSDLGVTWNKTPPMNDDLKFSAIQPTVLMHPAGKLQALVRTRQGRISEVWSEDSGRTWGSMQATTLPNPNSGIDAVMTSEGMSLLVYNHCLSGRTPLNVAISRDGKAWHQAVVLENTKGEYSYPAVIQAHDKLVHITYTWRRTRIKHAVVDATQLFNSSRASHE